MELDVSKLNEPPESLRARELSREGVEQVKSELRVKGKVGSRLELICVVPPVSLSSSLILFIFLSLSLSRATCLRSRGRAWVTSSMRRR